MSLNRIGDQGQGVKVCGLWIAFRRKLFEGNNARLRAARAFANLNLIVFKLPYCS